MTDRSAKIRARAAPRFRQNRQGNAISIFKRNVSKAIPTFGSRDGGVCARRNLITKSADVILKFCRHTNADAIRSRALEAAENRGCKRQGRKSKNIRRSDFRRSAIWRRARHETKPHNRLLGITAVLEPNQNGDSVAGRFLTNGDREFGQMRQILIQTRSKPLTKNSARCFFPIRMPSPEQMRRVRSARRKTPTLSIFCSNRLSPTKIRVSAFRQSAVWEVWKMQKPLSDYWNTAKNCL